MDVHALGLELEDIPRRARHDGFRAERLAKLGHVDLDGVRGGLGRVARPEALDELVDRDDPSGLEREHGEERAGLLPAERDRVSVLQRLQRSEELELDPRVPGPAGRAHSSRSFARRRPSVHARLEHPLSTVLDPSAMRNLCPKGDLHGCIRRRRSPCDAPACP